jgi:hypothetical protein
MFRQFSLHGSAAALKLSPFMDSHYKRWRTKTILWLTLIGVHWVSAGTPRDPLSPDEDKVSREATMLFVGVILTVLGDKLG